LRLLGRFADALPIYLALRDSLAATADTARQWHAEVWGADGLLRTGRLAEAGAALDRGFDLANGDPSREAWTRLLRSQLLHRRGRLDSALDQAQAALRAAHALRLRDLEARSHSLLGTVHSLSGRYRLAAAAAESALVLERELHNPSPALATQLNNLGVEYRHLGRLTDAERVLSEGLELAAEPRFLRAAMLLKANLSHVRLWTGQVEQALSLRAQVVRAAEALRDVQGLVMGNENLGSLYLSTGNLADARRGFEQSLAANSPVRIVHGRIAALWGLGRLETLERRTARSISLLEEAVVLADSTGFGRERAGIRASLSAAELAAGNPAAALRWAADALRVADSVDDPQARLEALEARAAALEAAGRGGAPEAYLETLDLLESWRGRLAMGDLRMGVVEPHWSAYEGAVRTLLARGDVGRAFQVAERARARTLLEMMAERDASRPPSSRAAVLRRELRVLAEERAAVLTDDDRARLDGEIGPLIDSLAAIEARGAGVPTAAPLSEITRGLIRPGRTLLAYFWGERSVYGWRIGTDGLHGDRLGPADSLGAIVDFLRSALETPDRGADWRPPAHHAYSRFVAPLGHHTGDDLLIVADGPLAHIPFETFLDPAGEAWGASKRIAYGPSTSVLLALERRGSAAHQARAVLAVGNPTVERIVGTGAADGLRTAPHRPLPYAEAEAREVYRLFRDQGAAMLLGGRATVERWLGLEPGRYRLLHFATHAVVSDRRPADTHLVLSGGSLDLAAIRHLDLQAELVTLSACETGLGQRLRGEGVIGLSHAFLAAGARRVLVTLWRVRDRSAADLMGDFYRELRAGHPAEEALRRVRARRVTDHPSQWAPFILVGATAGHRDG
jgi:CHAT domain-containing protein/tetratricopeptide (TPR) repeat protein